MGNLYSEPIRVELPTLDRDPERNFEELWRTFHVNRVRRVFDDGYGEVGDGPGRGDRFVGAHGVSFLSVV